MPERPLCSVCRKRRPERFCPALGEKICAVCCGTERERTIDCPADCAYLIKAHRYEQEQRQPPVPAEIPFTDTEIARAVIYENEPLINGLAHTILKFAAEQRSLADPDVLAAFIALGETYRTLVSGIYYEKPPTAPLQAALYTALAAFIQEYKKQAATAAIGVKDSSVFAVLVYLARLCAATTNGRSRARIFLQLLRAGTPQAQEQPGEASRIILP